MVIGISNEGPLNVDGRRCGFKDHQCVPNQRGTFIWAGAQRLNSTHVVDTDPVWIPRPRSRSGVHYDDMLQLWDFAEYSLGHTYTRRLRLTEECPKGSWTLELCASAHTNWESLYFEGGNMSPWVCSPRALCWWWCGWPGFHSGRERWPDLPAWRTESQLSHKQKESINSRLFRNQQRFAHQSSRQIQRKRLVTS